MSKVVVLLSGGIDSSVLASYLLARGDEVHALTVVYGQRHVIEIDSAMAVAASLGITHKIVDLSALREVMGGSSQTDATVEVPHGHYTDETMKQTVVPNRNMVLLAVACAYAISLKADDVAYAAHAGDHAIYPDCRPEFADAMGTAFTLADWHRVTLRRPFILLDKEGIVRRGHQLGMPFGLTYSCYEGDKEHCGKCGTCVERREAFALAGVDDPTTYKEG